MNKSKSKTLTLDKSKTWERKPHDDARFSEFRMEDLFLCHLCKEWYPWFIFCKGKMLFIDNNDNDIYSLMVNESHRDGKRWACDYCINICIKKHNIII